MASIGPVQRPSITAQASDSMPQIDSSTASHKKDHGYSFKFICPFSIPPTSEAAAVRIIKNLLFFGLYYLLFVYIVLFITLIPRRKVSLVFLVAMREIAFLYLLLLRALPNSFILNKTINKFFVLFLLCVITGVEMIVTRAGIHLLITLVSTTPVILFHAAFWREDLHLVNSEDGSAAGGEYLPIMQNEGAGDAAAESTYVV